MNEPDSDGDCVRSDWARDFGPATADKGAGKGVWITEYASKETKLHGVKYPSPDSTGGYSAAYTMPFAARNTVALLNSGASAAFYWEAEDEEHKSWGYVTRDGRKKPVYSALRALFPKIP
eukprot:gene41366-56401_t